MMKFKENRVGEKANVVGFHIHKVYQRVKLVEGKVE